MCGIAGFVGGFVPGLGGRMNRAQAHRGPDGSGVFEDAEAGAMLAHVRLAILDLSGAAAQPMCSPDGRFVLIYNGEIYNFVDLRHELEQTGRVFQSTGDTEVLLAGLEQYGEELLPRLNGMFALALWDRHQRELLLARDPLGIKPLYYALPVPGTLLFASEIKALAAHPELKREPDFVALQQHLALCHAVGERTALKGVRRLLPGTVLRWTAADRAFRVRRYKEAASAAGPLPAPAEAVAVLRAQLKEAVRRQLVADVPVGALFSGGLDSSLVARLAVEANGSNFRCYTVTYPAAENVLDQAEADAPYASDYASVLGIPWQELVIEPQVARLWPRLIHHLDEPLADPAAIACYLVAQQARQNGTTVLLCGQGADELFGGYPRYRAMHATRLADVLPGGLRRFLSRAARRALPGARGGSVGALCRRLRRLLGAIEMPADQRFLAYCRPTPEDEIQAVLNPLVRAELGQRTSADDCLELMQRCTGTGLKRFLLRDLSVYLPNHNLLYTDKMSMAVGLEARVPLLDQQLVDLVTAWPAEWKVARGQTKAILRQAARGLVPDRIIDRPKAGFGAPYRKWLRHDLGEMWNDLSAPATVKRRGWFDAHALRDARQRSQTGRADLYMLQWAVLTIELWAQQFLDRNPAE